MKTSASIGRSLLLVSMLAQLCRGQTVTTFDVLVSTGNFISVGSTTIKGNSSGLFVVGNGTLTALNSGHIGIGTTTPAGQIHGVGVAVLGIMSEFLWISSAAALRVGGDNVGAWSSAGPYSVAFGLNNSATSVGATVGGGQTNSAVGGYSTIAGGYINTAADSMATIAGGQQNTANLRASIGGGYIQTADDLATIAGGQLNTSNTYGSVGGGDGNDAGQWAAIGGGINNNSTAGPLSFIGGGLDNTTNGLGTAILGGGLRPEDGTNDGNLTRNYSSAVLGGAGNEANGGASSVVGGVDNIVNGYYSTILGGTGNSAAGYYSVAGGRFASAATTGTFVWADSQSTPFSAKAADEFRVRARGGFVFYSSETLPTVIVSSGAIVISTSPTAASAVPNLYVSSANGRVGIGTASPSAALEVSGDLRASSETLSATGASVYSLTTASGIHVLNGRIKLEPGAYIEWGDNTTSTTAVTNSGGGGGTGGLSWTKYTKSYADFAAGSTTSTSTLVTVAAGTVIHGVKIKHSTKFSGGSISAYTVSVGTGPGGNASTLYASPYDVFQVVSSTAMQFSQNFTAETDSGWSIGAAATSTGGNLNTASQGSVDIWILTSTTP